MQDSPSGLNSRSTNSNVTTDTGDYNTNEEGEVSPSEEELTNVIQHSDSDLDNYDYAKSYDKYYGIKDKNQDGSISPPSPIKVSNPNNPGPSNTPLVSTPPNDRQINTPETPTKNKKSPVVIAIKEKEEKKKKPSPIKFSTGTDQDERSEGKDVPLSKLITRSTPRPTRRVTRQDLRIKLNDIAPNSTPKLKNDRGPPSSRLKRKPLAPWLSGCAPKCNVEHQHQPFIEGQAPKCPEISRKQWQKETGSEKAWFNPLICQTDSSEEENEDEITTDELRTAEADSSEEEN